MNKRTNDNIKRVSAYIFSCVCAAAVSGILLLIFAGVMYALELPPEIAGALSFIAYAAGCGTSGLICGLIKGRGGLRTGLICGLAVSLSALAVSLLTGGFTGSAAAAKIIASVCASCIGSVVGVNLHK